MQRVVVVSQVGFVVKGWGGAEYMLVEGCLHNSLHGEHRRAPTRLSKKGKSDLRLSIDDGNNNNNKNKNNDNKNNDTTRTYLYRGHVTKHGTNYVNKILADDERNRFLLP